MSLNVTALGQRQGLQVPYKVHLLLCPLTLIFGCKSSFL